MVAAVSRGGSLAERAARRFTAAVCRDRRIDSARAARLATSPAAIRRDDSAEAPRAFFASRAPVAVGAVRLASVVRTVARQSAPIALSARDARHSRAAWLTATTAVSSETPGVLKGMKRVVNQPRVRRSVGAGSAVGNAHAKSVDQVRNWSPNVGE